MTCCRQVAVFNLWSKNVVDIRESYDQFWVTNTSIEYIDQAYLVLRFQRSFDSVFNQDMLQASHSSPSMPNGGLSITELCIYLSGPHAAL